MSKIRPKIAPQSATSRRPGIRGQFGCMDRVTKRHLICFQPRNYNKRKIGSVMYKVYLWCVQVHRRDDQQREPPTYVCRTQVGKTGSDGHPSATQQGMCRAGGLCQKKRKGKERNPIPIPSSNSNSIPRDIDIYPKRKKEKKRGNPPSCCAVCAILLPPLPVRPSRFPGSFNALQSKPMSESMSHATQQLKPARPRPRRPIIA